MLEILGYGAAISVGVAMGLMGAGGSILTILILVYLLGVPAVEATAYTLFVTGLVALAGSVSFIRRGLVSFRVGAVYALPSLVGVYSARRWLLPALPKVVFRSDFLVVSSDLFILLVIAVTMIFTALAMIRDIPLPVEDGPFRLSYLKIALSGAVVGFLTGFIGVGGGFLIVPGLTLMAGLPIKQATGTALGVIAVKSLPGFLGDLAHPIDWSLLFFFSSFCMLGLLLGTFLSYRIPSRRLKPAFGWFMLTIGISVILREAL